MAAPPNLIDFVESAGVPGVVAYGPDSQKQLEADFFREFWKIQNPRHAGAQGRTTSPRVGRR